MLSDKDRECLRAILETLPANARETARTLNPEPPVDEWVHVDTPLEELASAYRKRVPGMLGEPAKPKAWSLVERELGPLAEAAQELAERLETLSPEARDLARDLSREFENTFVGDRSPVQRLWSQACGYAYFPPDVHVSYDEDADPYYDAADRDGIRPFELKALAGVMKHLQAEAASRKDTPPARRAMPGHERIQRLISGLANHVVTRQARPRAHAIQIAKAIHRWATGETPGEDWGQRALERWRRAQKAENEEWDRRWAALAVK